MQAFLSGANFLLRSNSFTGIVVSTDQVRFRLFGAGFYYYYSDFNLAENIVGVGPVVVSGIFNATTSISGARMNSASSENEGIITNIATGWECSISRFELTRQ